MAQAILGGTQKETPHGEITELGSSKLVVTHVEVIKQREIINIPEIVVTEVPTTKYNTIEKDTVKYIPKEEETIKYAVTEVGTVKYTPTEEETVKYIVREIECEKPVLVDVPYERPIVREKEYTIATIKDLENLRELMAVVPKLLVELDKLRNYKLVEEVIKVPRVQYEPTTVERVVWSDVHKCKKCGGLVESN